MDNIYISFLYDYYGVLLTEKQQEYFEDYYFNNLTLQEIADNNNVSKNAIHKSIKDINTKLEYYEEKLNLYENSKNVKELIKDIDKEMKEQIEELI